MDRIVVTVGPLAAGNTSNIAQAQTPNANTTIILNGTLASNTGVFTGNIAGNILSVSNISAGDISPNQTLSGSTILTGTKVIGYGNVTGNGTGTYVVSPSQTVGNTTIYGNASATTDQPRQITITSVAGNETGNNFSISGTDWAGDIIGETIVGPGNAASVTSALSYATVTGISISGNATGIITAGTANTASSPWVRMDSWASPSVAVQCNVAGTGNYTVQQTMDDPNAAVNPVSPANVTWVNSPNTGMVNANTSQQGSYVYIPTFIRVLLNSGNGTITTTVVQAGAVPY